MQLRIEHDPSDPRRTRVTNAVTGEVMTGIHQITFVHRIGQLPVITLEFITPNVAVDVRGGR